MIHLLRNIKVPRPRSSNIPFFLNQLVHIAITTKSITLLIITSYYEQSNGSKVMNNLYHIIFPKLDTTFLTLYLLPPNFHLQYTVQKLCGTHHKLSPTRTSSLISTYVQNLQLQNKFP